MPNERLSAPAALRNRDVIVDVLRTALPASGMVLEIASGSGEHVLHFATAFPELVFQPSDVDRDALLSIASRTSEAGLSNLRPPLLLNAAAAEWPVARADAIVCINMVHIAAWATTIGMMRGARSCLLSGAPLFLYGPFRRAGVETAPSNEAFDQLLRSRDPAWGLRDLEAVNDLAVENGFSSPHITNMPANNLSVVFQRL